MKNIKDLLMGELIGKKVEVVKGLPSQVGMKGVIVDETKHMIIIKTKQGNKMVQKKQATFKVWVDNKPIQVEGTLLEHRPEDRIKVY